MDAINNGRGVAVEKGYSHMEAAVIPATDYLAVFGTAILPVLELKAAIPLGVGALGLPTWTTFWLAWLGSCLPAPFIVFFIERVIVWLSKSKVKFFNKFANWLLGKVEKHKGQIEKYGYLGEFIFVAIPLPGTGVWTGSLISAMLKLKPARAIAMVLIGNLVAGFLMLLLSKLFWPDLVLW